ncbi:hypothetical protein [Streptosporangium sp. NPDC020145]|uniref:hypothetical protein n=1 Tax=Streptosporangium sp. NPDC020145 TaxID=3154694 RepID=UPI0034255A24
MRPSTRSAVARLMAVAVTLGALMALAAPPASAGALAKRGDFSRSEDLVFSNPYSLPCDGVAYAVRKPFKAVYTEPGGDAVVISKGDANQHTLTATNTRTTTNTVADTYSVSAKIAGKLVPVEKIFEVSGETVYTSTHSVSTAKTVTFAVADAVVIKPTGNSRITATPTFFKTQVFAEYWTRGGSPPECGTPNKTAHRAHIDAVGGMGWVIQCDGRPCQAGKDYIPVSRNLRSDVIAQPDTLLTKKHSPLTYKLVKNCGLPSSNADYCQFQLPTQCSVDLNSRDTHQLSRDWTASVTCPWSMPFAEYDLVSSTYIETRDFDGLGPWKDDPTEYRTHCKVGKACEVKVTLDGTQRVAYSFSGGSWKFGSSRTLLIPTL